MPKDVHLENSSVQDMGALPFSRRNITTTVPIIGILFKATTIKPMEEIEENILMELPQALHRHRVKTMVRKVLASLQISTMSSLSGVLERQVLDCLSSLPHSLWHNVMT